MAKHTFSDKVFLTLKHKVARLDKLKTVANAEGRPLWKPMHMQPVFAGSDCVSLEAKPVGTDLYERGLCLPSDLHMDDDDMRLIVETVRDCF